MTIRKPFYEAVSLGDVYSNCAASLQHQSWKDIGDPVLKDPILIIDLFIRMFHLSVSTATLCGKHQRGLCVIGFSAKILEAFK